MGVIWCVLEGGLVEYIEKAKVEDQYRHPSHQPDTQ